MCKTLNCTPSELGQARKRLPSDIEFLERAYINMKEKELKAHKEASKKSKGRGKTIRKN